MTIKAIPTKYNGITFRSRTEARWAAFFDQLEIKWIYEPEGFVFEDGTKYLPDFYLPEMDVYFEVKSSKENITPYEQHKLDKAAENIPLVIGYADFTVESNLHYHEEESHLYSLDSDTVIAKCDKCGKYYFMGTMFSWICRCCKHYDGDRTSMWINTNHMKDDWQDDEINNAYSYAMALKFGERGMR